MKNYPPEFKADAVELYESRPEATIRSVAADLGINPDGRRRSNPGTSRKQDLAFLLQLADLLAQGCVLRGSSPSSARRAVRRSITSGSRGSCGRAGLGQAAVAGSAHTAALNALSNGVVDADTGPPAVPPTRLSPPSTRPASTRTSARSPRGRPQFWPTTTPVDHPSQSHLLLADVIHPSPAQKLGDIPKRVGHAENLPIHTHPTPTRFIRRVHDHRQIAGHGCQSVTGCSCSASASMSTSGCS